MHLFVSEYRLYWRITHPHIYRIANWTREKIRPKGLPRDLRENRHTSTDWIVAYINDADMPSSFIDEWVEYIRDKRTYICKVE